MAHPTYPYIFDPAHALAGNLIHHFVGGHGDNNFNDIKGGKVLLPVTSEITTWVDDSEYGRVADITSTASEIPFELTEAFLTTANRPFTVMVWLWKEVITAPDIFMGFRNLAGTDYMRLFSISTGGGDMGAQEKENAGSAQAASPGNAVASTWQLLTGTFVSATSRNGAIDDGNYVANTVSANPAGMDRFRMSFTTAGHAKIGTILMFNKALSKAEKDPFYASATRWNHLIAAPSGIPAKAWHHRTRVAE